MYSSYCVESATVTAIFLSSSSVTSSGQALVGVDLRTVSTLDTTSTGYLEGRHSTVQPLSASGGGHPVRKIVKTVDLANWFGVPAALDRFDLSAAYNTTPDRQVFFHLFASDPDPANTDIDEVWCDMKITYNLRFFDPIVPAAS
jgi:hypothetical protein